MYNRYAEAMAKFWAIEAKELADKAEAATDPDRKKQLLADVELAKNREAQYRRFLTEEKLV